MSGHLYLFNSNFNSSVSLKGAGLGTNGSTVYISVWLTSLTPCTLHSVAGKRNPFSFSKYCGNLQADRHSHLLPSYFWVVILLKFIYASVQVSNTFVLTFCFKLFNLVSQRFPFLVLKVLLASRVTLRSYFLHSFGLGSATTAI
jgi:hypothetical protein